MKFLIACFLFWIPLLCLAQSPCASTAHDEFDFWLGDWEVYQTEADTLVGRNSITKTLNGCVVEEHWKSLGGFEGKSFNTYDTVQKTWHQTWVDVGGNTFQFSGKLVEGNMVMTGKGTTGGKTYAFEMTYYPQENGDVRQVWKANEEGKTEWATWFDGMYKKE